MRVSTQKKIIIFVKMEKFEPKGDVSKKKFAVSQSFRN